MQRKRPQVGPWTERAIPNIAGKNWVVSTSRWEESGKSLARALGGRMLNGGYGSS